MTSGGTPQDKEAHLKGCMNGTKLTLCMVVENEAKLVEACLQSIFSAVDEIIIVDIGSTDDTKAICRKFGATVVDYVWDGDFAAARNEGFTLASGEWILWLYADEIVEEDDLPNLRQALIDCKQDALAIHLVSVDGEDDNIDGPFQFSQVRLFKNHQAAFFDGKAPEPFNGAHIGEVVEIPVRVYHRGYMQDIGQQKQKFERNIRLLEKERGDLAYSPWFDYHIAREYFNLQSYGRAFAEVNRSILRFITFGLQPPALAYRLKYLILLTHGTMAGAVAGIDKAIQMYPDYVDLHFFKGLFLFADGKFTEAEDVFRECITLGDDNRGYLTMRGVGSFQSWFYIGQCREKLGQYDKARDAYMTSLQISASYSPASKALADLASEVNRSERQ